MSIRLWCVYKHTCTINNKSYIGITCQKVQKRWGVSGSRYLEESAEGNYYHVAFARAILAYGWENFTHEILYTNLTKKEAQQKEVELIAFYHTYIRDQDCKGYNMTRGGEGTCRYETEEERIAAQKRAMKKGNDKRRADFAKHEKDKAASRAWYDDIKENNLVKYQNQLDRAKARITTYRNDPAKREKYLQISKDHTVKVGEIRKLLKALYTQNESVFTSLEKSLIFDYKPGSHHYKCNSKKQLNEIYNRVKLLIGDEQNEQYDTSRAS